MEVVETLQTIIFDLDGTLYDEERIYDFYAEELASRLPEGVRDAFVREWGQTKSGSGRSLMGLGYDVAGRRLFRHSGGRATEYLTWEGEMIAPDPGEETMPGPLEFGYTTPYINIGDWWALLAALAAHHGLPGEARQDAFRATRAHMSTDAGRLSPSPALRQTLGRLRGAGPRLVAMSNSPMESVVDTFDQLGIRDCFDAVVGDAAKPTGMMEFLREDVDPATTLSVGDNFVNDIEPALDAGARALYIDRHATGLGRDRKRCALAPTGESAWEWLLEHVRR
jgi:putative hydrolase of the HAD superfamily